MLLHSGKNYLQAGDSFDKAPELFSSSLAAHFAVVSWLQCFKRWGCGCKADEMLFTAARWTDGGRCYIYCWMLQLHQHICCSIQHPHGRPDPVPTPLCLMPSCSCPCYVCTCPCRDEGSAWDLRWFPVYCATYLTYVHYVQPPVRDALLR